MTLPINYDKISQMDLSFLLDTTSSGIRLNDTDKKTVTASDKDAELLLNVWKKASRIREKTYKLSEISNQDFSRLKSGGFVIGDSHACQLTPRGQKIIKVMTLGETNAFLKNQKSKSYTEIMASTNKRGKKGYRIASAIDNTNEESFNLTKEDWLRIGNAAGWIGKSASQYDEKYMPGQDSYTDEEKAQLKELMDSALEAEKEFSSDELENHADDTKNRRRQIKVYFEDGDTITTEINGSKQEIKDYYIGKPFELDELKPSVKATKVEFLD